MKHHNLTGKIFWNLKVLKRDHYRPSRAYCYWICDCDCGRRISCRSDQLRNGTTTCCPVCNKKYHEAARLQRWEEKSIIQIEKAKEMKSRLRVRKVKNESGSSVVYIKGTMYSIENIVNMRDSFQMSFDEIASLLNITKQQARDEYLTRSKKVTKLPHITQSVHTESVLHNLQKTDKDNHNLLKYRNLF